MLYVLAGSGQASVSAKKSNVHTAINNFAVRGTKVGSRCAPKGQGRAQGGEKQRHAQYTYVHVRMHISAGEISRFLRNSSY